MKEIKKEQFISSIRPGDIGIICAKNPFASLQNLYRKRFNEGPERASHGFFVKDPPKISEANGLTVKEATFLKNIGDSTKTWIFRYKDLTPEQLRGMLTYCRAAEETGGHYSIGGILQFAKAFILGKKDSVKDESGVFCTEYTSQIITLGAGIYEDYIKTRKSFEIDPSYQLNWFLEYGQSCGWKLVGKYDGSKYYSPEV